MFGRRWERTAMLMLGGLLTMLLMGRQLDVLCRSKFLQFAEELHVLSKELETVREDICHWSDISGKVARLEDAMEGQQKKLKEIQQSLHLKSADLNGMAP